MSIQAMVWALEQQEIQEPAARHVLLCLANYADKEGRGAFPSSSSLSQDTGLSVRTVKYKLDTLESAGLIRRGKQAIAAAYIDRADRRPTVYDMAMERGAPHAPGSERGANDDATGCSSRQNGVQMTTERGAAAAPNPSVIRHIPVKEQEQGAKASRLPSDWSLPAEWMAWALADRPEFQEQDVRRAAEQFSDFWKAKAGKDAAKLDWFATWRNWFRRERSPAGSFRATPAMSRHVGLDRIDHTIGLTERGDGTYDF